MTDRPVALTLTCVTAYLAGGVPIGWLLVRHRLHGLDIRLYGSGNVGASNVYRHAGLGLAALVGVAQFAVGAAVVVAGRLLGFGTGELCLVGLCAVVGNGWPAMLRFNGGRCVAVATGVSGALTPLTLPVLLAAYAVGAAEQQLAAGVLAGFVLLPAANLLAYGPQTALLATGLLVIVVLRRLEGVSADAREHGWSRRLVTDRVVFDRRPGRPLAGPRTDQVAVARRPPTRRASRA